MNKLAAIVFLGQIKWFLQDTLFYFKINFIGHISIHNWWDTPLVIHRCSKRIEEKIYVFLIPYFFIFFSFNRAKFPGLRFFAGLCSWFRKKIKQHVIRSIQRNHSHISWWECNTSSFLTPAKWLKWDSSWQLKPSHDDPI